MAFYQSLMPYVLYFIAYSIALHCDPLATFVFDGGFLIFM